MECGRPRSAAYFNRMNGPGNRAVHSRREARGTGLVQTSGLRVIRPATVASPQKRPYFPRLRIESSFLDGSLTRRARPLYSDAMTIQPGLISIVVAAGVLAAQPKQTSAASQQV